MLKGLPTVTKMQLQPLVGWKKLGNRCCIVMIEVIKMELLEINLTFMFYAFWWIFVCGSICLCGHCISWEKIVNFAPLWASFQQKWHLQYLNTKLRSRQNFYVYSNLLIMLLLCIGLNFFTSLQTCPRIVSKYLQNQPLEILILLKSNH